MISAGRLVREVKGLRPLRRAAGTVAGPRSEMAVDVALVLAVDVSGSVSERRLLLQRQGYADALCHPGIGHAVQSGALGRIAVTFVEWSEARRQTQAVGWRLIDNAATARAFGDAITAAERPMPGWTSISAAIDYSVRLFADSEFAAERKVIDISGDGANNDGRNVTDARDDAVRSGVTLNGLPIIEVEPDLEAYYRQNVIGGPDAFVVVAQDIADFRTAVLRKLLVEIAGMRPPDRRARAA